MMKKINLFILCLLCTSTMSKKEDTPPKENGSTKISIAASMNPALFGFGEPILPSGPGGIGSIGIPGTIGIPEAIGIPGTIGIPEAIGMPGGVGIPGKPVKPIICTHNPTMQGIIPPCTMFGMKPVISGMWPGWKPVFYGTGTFPGGHVLGESGMQMLCPPCPGFSGFTLPLMDGTCPPCKGPAGVGGVGGGGGAGGGISPQLLEMIIRKKPEQSLKRSQSTGDDYVAHEERHYKFHQELLTWEEAEMVCMSEGAHLAVINSKTEADILVNMFTENRKTSNGNSESIYVGFHDLQTLGQYLTIEGQTLEEAGYAEWQQGQPDNGAGGQNGPENCGSMHISGLLNDIHCTNDKLPFICEKP